jgi:hypothetical protein
MCFVLMSSRNDVTPTVKGILDRPSSLMFTVMRKRPKNNLNNRNTQIP